MQPSRESGLRGSCGAPYLVAFAVYHCRLMCAELINSAEATKKRPIRRSEQANAHNSPRWTMNGRKEN
jgi:hypothetical protein